MNALLQWADSEDAITVDVDALWQTALAEGRDVGIKVKRALREDVASAMDDMSEFAIISAWARGRGGKSGK
jgi:hypothetical protein